MTETSSWYKKNISDVEKTLNSNTEAGLSQDTVEKRFLEYGPNELIETAGRSPLKIIMEQLFSTMVLILLAATVISGFLGDITEVIAIAAIVVLFVALDFSRNIKQKEQWLH